MAAGNSFCIFTRVRSIPRVSARPRVKVCGPHCRDSLPHPFRPATCSPLTAFVWKQARTGRHDVHGGKDAGAARSRRSGEMTHRTGRGGNTRLAVHGPPRRRINNCFPAPQGISAKSLLLQRSRHENPASRPHTCNSANSFTGLGSVPSSYESAIIQ